MLNHVLGAAVWGLPGAVVLRQAMATVVAAAAAAAAAAATAAPQRETQYLLIFKKGLSAAKDKNTGRGVGPDPAVRAATRAATGPHVAQCVYFYLLRRIIRV